MPPFVAYHGVSGSAHQQRVDELAAQGYRPTSLSVSGDPADPRYAAVWVQRPGPGWTAVHGLSPADYQARFDELTGAGYAPVLVDATGPADGARFTALFEQGGPGRWFARHHLRWGGAGEPGTLPFENRRAFDEGFLPRWLAAYGTPDDVRFAGVWHGNDDAVRWSWWWTDPDAYQRFFEALRDAGTRPASVTPAPTSWYLSVFYDQPLGAWSARHRLTGSEYQVEFDASVAAGLVPVFVRAGGTGDGTRYASLFAGTDQPLPRRWSVTGSAAMPAAALDQAVRAFMTADGVRAGAVAVARAGEVLLARGYTWAEDDYPVTEPGTTFRLASVSKAFTAAAVEQLVAQGLLAWDTPVFPRLGLTGAVLPGQTVDPDIDGVTVRQLLLRASGMRRDVGDLRAIAARLSTAVVPTRAQLVAFLHGEPLEFRPSPPDPPGEGHYSNAAFTVLTSLVEQVSGRPFVDHLRTALLHPEGIGDLAVAATRHGGAQPGEVASYDSPGVSASLLEPGTDRLAPDAHGGAFTLENGEGSGGLLASAPSVARFIARHAVWDVGPRQTAARYGEFEGTTAGAVSRGDGLDVAFLFNRRVGDAQHDGIRRAVDEWLDSVG